MSSVGQVSGTVCESRLVTSLSFPFRFSDDCFPATIERVHYNGRRGLELDSVAHQDLAQARRPALIHAHPGHELYVLGWVKRARPLIFVLTDGSGHTTQGRSGSTSSLVERLGATKGEVFCPLTDRAIYDAILTGDLLLFENLLETIVRSLIANEIDLVAGDAVEGFNPSHDICRFLIDGAVEAVKRRTGRVISNYEIRLTALEKGEPDRHDHQCRHLVLSPDALQEKLQAACSYKGLQGEVRDHMHACGLEYFRTECFRKAPARRSVDLVAHTPFYEKVGQQRVQDGIYKTPLRYRDHVMPIFDAISHYATR